MAEGGSFLNPRVGEPNRRAFLDLDRRVSQLAEDLTAGDVSFAGDVEVDGTLTANHIHGNLAGAVYLHVKNTSGVTIPAGSPVYATGSVGASGETEVARSECDVSSTMPALGVIGAELVNNAEGHATVLGVAKQLDTSAWSVNDSLYVSASGTLTNVRPTGASELVQKIGRVIRADANTGEVLVLGAGRSNDVPNGLSPTITLTGDASGSVTLTELGSGTLTVTVNDDSHDHTIANVDNLQTTLDGKAASSHSHSYLPLSGGTLTGQLTIERSGSEPANFIDIYNTDNATGEKAGLRMRTASGWSTTMFAEQGNWWHAFGNSSGIAQWGYDGTNLKVGSTNVSLEGHTHSYLPTSGGTISGSLVVTSTIDANEYYGDNGSATDPSFTFTSDQDTGIYRQTTNSIGFATGGIQHYWNANGIYLANGDWFRNTGSAGLYNQSYGGGIYMIDSTWVRVYNNKAFYSGGGIIRSDGGNAFAMPNSTGTWSFNTVRYDTNGGILRQYLSTAATKANITEMKGVLEYLNERNLIYSLRPVIFTEAEDRTDFEGNPVRTTRGEYGHGLIAEEVLEVAPELAYFGKDGELVSYGNDHLIPDIIAELQRLMPMVEELYSAANPDWVAPVPRSTESIATERAKYDEAAAVQAAIGFDDISDPSNGQRHLENEE